MTEKPILFLGHCAMVYAQSVQWFEQLYSLIARGDADGAIDLVFAKVDGLLCNGSFAEVDSLLDALDLERLDSDNVIAWLTITLAAADELQRRRPFLERAERRLRVLAGSRTERLLSGLN